MAKDWQALQEIYQAWGYEGGLSHIASGEQWLVDAEILSLWTDPASWGMNRENER
jgi:hypothetical protein